MKNNNDNDDKIILNTMKEITKTYYLTFKENKPYLIFSTQNLTPENLKKVRKVNKKYNKKLPEYFLEHDWVYLDEKGKLLHCNREDEYYLNKEIHNDDLDKAIEKKLWEKLKNAYYNPLLLTPEEDEEYYSKRLIYGDPQDQNEFKKNVICDLKEKDKNINIILVAAKLDYYINNNKKETILRTIGRSELLDELNEIKDYNLMFHFTEKTKLDFFQNIKHWSLSTEESLAFIFQTESDVDVVVEYILNDDFSFKLKEIAII